MTSARPVSSDLDEAARDVLWRLAPECAAVLLGGPLATPDQADPLISAYFERAPGARAPPCAAFDPGAYTGHAAGEDPFAHFLVHAQTGAADPHPLVSLRHLRAGAGDAPVLERLGDLLTDRVAGSPHPLLWPAFVRGQPGAARMTLPQMLARFGACDEALTLAPHPLFDPEHYRRANGVHGRNELLHYLRAGAGALHTHPLVSPPFVAAALGPAAHAGETLLERYLASWPQAPVDPSLFVDVRFLAGRLAPAAEGDPSEPLSRALAAGAPSGDLHPEADARVIAFVLGGGVHDARGRLEATLAELATRTRRPTGIDGRPRVSVVMPTFHKSAYTALSVLAAERALAAVPHEILVMENGGDALRHEELRRIFSALPAIRFVKLPVNRFFGEASNLGADLASGEHILFLNNDAFLSPRFGEVLSELLDGADGPPDVLGAALILPDGALQEFGGVVSDDGQVIQIGKHLTPAMLDGQDGLKTVDYASAACLCVSRRALERVAGFDPAFEPFYYEDTDLCRRLRVAGFPVQVSARLRALHVENASTRELLGAGMDAAVARSRASFARRWLREGGRDALVRGEGVRLAEVESSRPLALVATPFDITVGGGEAYLLNSARVLSATHRVVLASPLPISRARVAFACRALGVEPFPFELRTVERLSQGGEAFDLAFVMGNEIVPFLAAPGRRSLYHLQFPFPWRHLAGFDFTRLADYDAIVVNSRFTAEWTWRRLEEAAVRAAPPVTVVRPPVAPIPPGGVRRGGPLRIANVGRFFPGRRSKRQDVVLDIVQALRTEGIAATAVLMGAVAPHAESEAFFLEVARRAEAMGGIEVVREAGRRDVESVLQDADVYLHTGGFDVDASLHPEGLEHFGIAVAEAIHAGCHPVVVAQGGPREIVETQGVGDVFTTVAQAVAHLRAFVDAGRGPTCGWRGSPLDREFDAALRQLASDEAGGKAQVVALPVRQRAN